MPPKAKPIESKSMKSVDQDAWRSELESIAINDEHWWCSVCMIVETLPEHCQVVDLFNEAAEDGKRRAIHPLAYQNVMRNVKILAKPDPNKCPVMQGVCHFANKQISEGEKTLSSWLLARIVKYFVHRAKVADIMKYKSKIRLDRKTAEEILTMQAVANVVSAEKKRDSRQKTRAPGEGSPENKAYTKLRKRGEEWRDRIYMEDAPEGGPNLYIVMSGFYDPKLPIELVRAGVPLTCILSIQQPGEKLQSLNPPVLSADEGSFTEGKLDISSPSSIAERKKVEIYEFWKSLNKYLIDRTANREFCSVLRRAFCLPKMKPSMSDGEYMEQKEDIYDRLSYILYDLCDISRQHVRYIRSMRLQAHLAKERPEEQKITVYSSIMDAIPAECSTVPMILHALLVQVEAYFPSLEYDSHVDGNIEYEPDGTDIDTHVRPGVTRLASREEDLPTHRDSIRTSQMWREKSMVGGKRSLVQIRELNHLYGIHTDSEPSPGLQNLNLILHGNKFDLDAYYITLNEKGGDSFETKISCLSDIGLRVLEKSSVVALWNNIPKLTKDDMNKYAYHMFRICQFYTEEKIDSCILSHYIHLSLFDQMMHNQKPCLNGREKNVLERRVSFPNHKLLQSELHQQRTISEASSVFKGKHYSNISAEEKSPVHSHSDSSIDYLRNVEESLECPSLFALVDIREMLQPGCLENLRSKRGNVESQLLDEFDNVQLLSPAVFLQIMHECSQELDILEHKYFEPTDSMLLYFHNQHKANDVSEEYFTASIRTPVCIRDFCEYVVDEEREWIEEENERYDAKLVEQRAQNTLGMLDQDSQFNMNTVAEYTDADFILPMSLKAEDIRKKRVSEGARVELGRKIEKVARKEKQEKTVEGMKRIRTSESLSKREKYNEVKDSEVDVSFLPLRKVDSLHCAKENEPYRFIGYDLGKCRVQVSGHDKHYWSMDGTSVQVCLEEWLYTKTQLYITITLSGSALKLNSIIGDRLAPVEPLTFHITLKNGIILAFSRWPMVSPGFSRPSSTYSAELNGGGRETEDLSVSSTSKVPKNIVRQGRIIKKRKSNGASMVSQDLPQPELTEIEFQFQASWPSGLIVEMVMGDGPDNPFYIKQSYVSKGPECDDIRNESYRKFIRNGTILKFLQDETIVVLRPNATVVKCMAFEKAIIGERNSLENPDVTTTRGGSKLEGISKITDSNSTRKKNSTLTKKRLRKPFDDEQIFNEEEQVENIRTSLKHFDESGKFKISHYCVLEPEGRHYEVVDGKILHEFDQELVRTASDYEVDEKFIRRTDGTNMLIKSEGSLVVSFPDGSRIITDYIVEEDLIYCDWTEEEFISQVSEEKQINDISSEDGYVSVLLMTRMEHKNYATVIYNQVQADCTLLMPGGTKVLISRHGLYHIETDSQTTLEVQKDSLTFSTKILGTSAAVSTSVYNLKQSLEKDTPNSPLLTTTDMFGNIFTVHNDGKTILKHVDDSQSEQHNHELHDEGIEKGGREVDEAGEEKRALAQREHYRIFVMNRDLTAYEYLHHSVRKEQEEVCSDEHCSMLLHPIAHLPGLDYCTTLTPLDAKTASQAWLQPYCDPKVRPTNQDRRDLPRSTYSIPYDWLFPYGKNGDGIWKNTWDVPLRNSVGDSVPDVLKIRILQAIKPEGEKGLNTVINLQRSLGRYWKEMINVFGEYKSFHPEDRRTAEERSLENWLRDLALGRKRTIDIETYNRGLLKNRKGREREPSRTKSDVFKSVKRREQEKEDVAWYQMCIREHQVIPYFINVPGACFLWVLDCVEKALDTVEAQILESTNQLEPSSDPHGEDVSRNSEKLNL